MKSILVKSDYYQHLLKVADFFSAHESEYNIITCSEYTRRLSDMRLCGQWCQGLMDQLIWTKRVCQLCINLIMIRVIANQEPGDEISGEDEILYILESIVDCCDLGIEMLTREGIYHKRFITSYMWVFPTPGRPKRRGV